MPATTITYSDFAKRVGITPQAVSKAAQPGGWLNPALVGPGQLAPRKANKCYRDRNTSKVRGKNAAAPIVADAHLPEGVPPEFVSRAVKSKYSAQKEKQAVMEGARVLIDSRGAGYAIGGAFRLLVQALDEALGPRLRGRLSGCATEEEELDVLVKEKESLLLKLQSVCGRLGRVPNRPTLARWSIWRYGRAWG